MNFKSISIYLLVALVLATAVFVAVQGSQDKEVSTQVAIDGDFSCTVNGKEFSDGQRMNVTTEGGKLNVHVETDNLTMILFIGQLKYADDVVTVTDESSVPTHSADFSLVVKDGCSECIMLVSNMIDEGEDGRLDLTCTVGDNVKLTFEGKEYKTGDVLTLYHDSTLTAESQVGRVTINYHGSWVDSYGIEGSVDGYELGTSIPIDISYFSYGGATGTLNVWIDN